MASCTLMLTVETDLYVDLIGDLARAQDAVRFRHGDFFRNFERRIARLAGGEFTFVEPVYLGEGMFVAPPPPELVRLVADARAIGLL